MSIDFLAKFAMFRSGTLLEIYLFASLWMLANTGRTSFESGEFRIELGTVMTRLGIRIHLCVRPSAARFR